MSVFVEGVVGGDDLELKLEPDADSADMEVPTMDDISCGGGVISEEDDEGDSADSQLTSTGGGSDTEALIKRLLTRVRILESQVTSCLENQPLLYQVFGKCNVLEQRLKGMRKVVDGRLSRLEKGSVRSGSSQDVTGSNGRRRTIPPKDIKKATEVELALYDSAGDEDSEPDQLDDDRDRQLLDDAPPQPDLAAAADRVTRATSSSGRQPKEGHLNRKNRNIICQSKPFSCKFCPASPLLGFSDAETLAAHYTSEHPLPGSGTGSPGPSSSIRVNRSLKTTPKHTKEAHGQDGVKREPIQTTFPCPEACGRIFKEKHAMNIHLVACRGLKPYECPYCKKKYGNKNGLRAHLASADGEGKRVEPRAICSECGRNIRRRLLQKHMETHVPKEERQRHICDQCGSGFLHPDSLRRHQREHTKVGEPRIPCNHCKKTFKTPDNLRNHMQLLTSRGRHICDECGKCFSQPQYLRIHKKNLACRRKGNSCSLTL